MKGKTMTQAAIKSVPATNTLRAKFHQLEKEMNATFSERENEIRCLIVALLSREHLLLLGPAGTAKSALANVLCGAIDGGKFFQHLLTRFSPPEELYGPISLDGLKHDRYRRVGAGKLQTAHVAFIDEIYKANSAVLNSMLTLLNERKFDDDGSRHDVPLEITVGASNELPESSELAALHDRFLLRSWLTYTKTPQAFRRLLCGTEPQISVSIHLDEIRAAHVEVAAMPISDAAVDELFKLREEVKKDAACVASDRRWRKAMGVLKAAAWLEGQSEVTPEAFPILANVLWETVEQIAKLKALVSKYTSAELAEAQEIADTVSALTNDLPKTDDPAYQSKLVSVTKELKKAEERLRKVGDACKGAQSKARILGIADEIKSRYVQYKRQAEKALDL